MKLPYDDAHAGTITITRGREHGAHYLAIKDDGNGVPRDAEGIPDFKCVATHICDSIKRRLKADGSAALITVTSSLEAAVNPVVVNARGLPGYTFGCHCMPRKNSSPAETGKADEMPGWHPAERYSGLPS